MAIWSWFRVRRWTANWTCYWQSSLFQLWFWRHHFPLLLPPISESPRCWWQLQYTRNPEGSVTLLCKSLYESRTNNMLIVLYRFKCRHVSPEDRKPNRLRLGFSFLLLEFWCSLFFLRKAIHSYRFLSTCSVLPNIHQSSASLQSTCFFGCS